MTGLPRRDGSFVDVLDSGVEGVRQRMVFHKLQSDFLESIDVSELTDKQLRNVLHQAILLISGLIKSQASMSVEKSSAMRRT